MAEATPLQLTEVTLHLYDVGKLPALRRANDFGATLGIGALHAGVEVHGIEVSFAHHEAGGTGIIQYSPKRCAEYRFRESIAMGSAAISKEGLEALLRELRPQWPASGYDLLRRNCCTFADEFCVALGVGRIPERVNRLASAGAVLMDGLGTARSTALTASRALAGTAGCAVRALDERYALSLEDGARKGAAVGLALASSGASALGGVLSAVAGALCERNGGGGSGRERDGERAERRPRGGAPDAAAQ